MLNITHNDIIRQAKARCQSFVDHIKAIGNYCEQISHNKHIPRFRIYDSNHWFKTHLMDVDERTITVYDDKIDKAFIENIAQVYYGFFGYDNIEVIYV